MSQCYFESLFLELFNYLYPNNVEISKSRKERISYLHFEAIFFLIFITYHINLIVTPVFMLFSVKGGQ